MRKTESSRRRRGRSGRLSRLTALAAALLLASCASFQGIGSDARPKAIQDYASSESLPAQAGAWPGASWAAAVGGPQLQALIDEALANSPNLQVAAARVASARALADAARASERPTIGGAFSSSYQRFSEHGMYPPPLAGSRDTINDLTLQLSYDLDLWGRHSAELRSALSQGKAAEAERQTARLALSTAVARAWVQLAREYGQLDLIGRQIELRQELDRLTALRVRAGLDNRSENEQARQQLATLRAEQSQWREALQLTRNQIAALLGQGPDRGLKLPRPALPAAAAAALPDRLPLTLLGRRPDIVAARWQVEAAQGDIDVAKAQFYPDVNLTAFAGLSSLGLSNLIESGSRTAGIGPAIRVPLFETGALRAQLKGRVAAYEAAVASYNQSLTDALHEVADQLQSLRAAEVQQQQLQLATQAADNGLQHARRRERAGTANMVPVLSGEMAVVAQRRAELDSAARRADLGIGLIKALGGGYEDAAATAAADNKTSTGSAS